MKLRNVLFCSLIALGALSVPARGDVDIIIEVPPPPARAEVVPPSRAGYVWAQGYWRWDGHRHVWIPGRWIRERPGYVWNREHWEQRKGAYYFVPGRWERRDEYNARDPERYRGHERDREYHHRERR